MFVDVTIGVPNPEAVDTRRWRRLPYGTVTVKAVKGGLEFRRWRRCHHHANAAVIVSLDDGK